MARLFLCYTDWVNSCKNCNLTIDGKNKTYCKKCNSERSKIRYRNNKSFLLSNQKQYYENNKESILEKRKTYYTENKDAILEKQLSYRKDNKDAIRERDKKYYENNKGYFRRKHSRRLAIKLKNGFEPYDELQVLAKYGSNCHICNKAIDLDAPRRVGAGNGWEYGLHIDHVIPLSKGGPDTLENVRPAHAVCNLQKSNHML